MVMFGVVVGVVSEIGVLEMSETKCKDCGAPTQPGPGSARCPECWEDRCSVSKAAEAWTTEIDVSGDRSWVFEAGADWMLATVLEQLRSEEAYSFSVYQLVQTGHLPHHTAWADWLEEQFKRGRG